jgi:hypothetical protein
VKEAEVDDRKKNAKKDQRGRQRWRKVDDNEKRRQMMPFEPGGSARIATPEAKKNADVDRTP